MVILTDCFDTLIIRREHPHQVIYRWAQCVNRIYKKIDSDVLLLDRNEFCKTENILKNGIYPVYEKLSQKYYQAGLIDNKDEFISIIQNLELLCEKSTIRKNAKVVTYLLRKKEKGEKIYCVSDYHLTSEHISELLHYVGIDFIDGVFSSASYGETKSEGKLYQVVLEKLNLQACECIMIGDDIKSDVKNAKKANIDSKWFSNDLHKNIIRINNKLHHLPTIKQIGKEYWKTTGDYQEFSIILFSFCERLFHETENRKASQIVFLAREGYYLKKCFDRYQEIRIPKEKKIHTEYLKLSRRAIHSVQINKCVPSFFDNISVHNYFLSVGFSNEEARQFEKELCLTEPDKVIHSFGHSHEAEILWEKMGNTIVNRINDNKNAFDRYVHGKTDGRELILVDVGWTGRMQQGIDVLFDDISTQGYYLGIYDNLQDKPYVNRQGLIFNKNENGNLSKYFYILRSNIQLYEQLLLAPHGSACFYEDKGDSISVFETWDLVEKDLYNEVISKVQVEIMKKFESLCTYSFDGICASCYEPNEFNKELARLMLRMCLLQSKSRMSFMQRLNKGFSQNFQQQSNGLNFSAKKVNINVIDVVFHPDRMVRYVSKMGVVLEKKNMGFLGRFIMTVFYFWVRMILCI